jgi:2-hydroxychromene-2-carboxylate isomerase
VTGVQTCALPICGGFGSPTFFLNGGDMYFGNDRLELMQAAIDRADG